MIGSVGSDDQLTGHKGMQIAAGFGAAEDKFSRPQRPEFDGRDTAPIGFQMALFLKPFMLAESHTFSGNQFDGVTVQLQTVSDIKGRELQDQSVALVYHKA